MLRVKVPCRDEGEFWARLADHVAKNGIRVPSATPKPVGARVRLALEFKDGRTLAGDGVVDSHVDLDAGRGMCVRFLSLDRDGAAAADEAPAPPAPPGLPARDEPLEEADLFDDVQAEAPPPADPLVTSGEIAAAWARRGARLRRAALWIAAAAVVATGAGTALLRSGAAAPDEGARVAAHVAAADRLLAEGRLVGEDGALGRLLAAQRLAPADRAVAERLERAADLLERLGASALQRGDLAVAAIHLSDARLAAPGRTSIRAKLAAVERARAADPRRAR